MKRDAKDGIGVSLALLSDGAAGCASAGAALAAASASKRMGAAESLMGTLYLAGRERTVTATSRLGLALFVVGGMVIGT